MSCQSYPYASCSDPIFSRQRLLQRSARQQHESASLLCPPSHITIPHQNQQQMPFSEQEETEEDSCLPGWKLSAASPLPSAALSHHAALLTALCLRLGRRRLRLNQLHVRLRQCA